MAGKTLLVDTNVLLEATAPARPLHGRARAVLDDWPNEGIRLFASGQIYREYLVVATRPTEQNGLGLDPADAVANVVAMSGRLTPLDERRRVSERLRALVRESGCRGRSIHDANLVATALEHGVEGIVTANVTDFARFESHVELLDLASA